MLDRRSMLACLAAAVAAPALALPTPAMPRIHRRYIDGSFGQIHLREAQPTGKASAVPLVLLHQSPLSGRMFDHILPLLAVDRIVLAVDMPGYGESDRPANPPRLAGYGDAILDALSPVYGTRIDLLGYHTGAAIAADLAARRAAHVRRLVLISIPFFDTVRRNKLLEQFAQKTGYADDGSHLQRLWAGSFGVKPKDQSLDDVARIVAEKQRAGLYGEWALAAAIATDLTATLGAIRQQTLVLAPHDGLQEESRAAAKLIPHARLVELPAHAYGLFDAAPAEIAAQILPFL